MTSSKGGYQLPETTLRSFTNYGKNYIAALSRHRNVWPITITLIISPSSLGSETSLNSLLNTSSLRIVSFHPVRLVLFESSSVSVARPTVSPSRISTPGFTMFFPYNYLRTTAVTKTTITLYRCPT